MAIITIIGAGMMGSAIGYPASDNGHIVRLVGTPLDDAIIEHARNTGEHLTMKRKLPESYEFYNISELGAALDGASLIVCGVSSFGVEWFADRILPILPEGVPVLSITKGMFDTDEGKLVPYPHYFRERRDISINAVGGPCTSYELADHDPSYVAFCGNDINELRIIRDMFVTDYYHVDITTDVVGVECAVAMKNAYALGVTLAVGLSERYEGVGGKQHYNSQAALFLQSVREMRKLLKLVGGADDNIVYGAGDLYVTIFGGRTRFIGTLLGRGVSMEDALAELKGVTLESLVIAKRTARAVNKLIERGEALSSDFPLLLHIADIIENDAPVSIPWASFQTETI